MNYTIEIMSRNVLPPLKFEGEAEDEFEARCLQWETVDKDKSFWRAVVNDGRNHLAVQSPLFRNSENGCDQLSGLISNLGTALVHRHKALASMTDAV